MENQKNPFWVGAIIWKDFTEHSFQLNFLEEALNGQLCLSDYGTGLEYFNFIPMVLTPNNRVHEEDISYVSKKKELDIHLKVDYQAVINAGVSGFLPLVGEVLLKGIDQALNQSIRDFNWIQFRRDVKQLLSENGWLVEVESA